MCFLLRILPSDGKEILDLLWGVVPSSLSPRMPDSAWLLPRLARLLLLLMDWAARVAELLLLSLGDIRGICVNLSSGVYNDSLLVYRCLWSDRGVTGGETNEERLE